MALRHWFHFNGDFTDYGLSETTITPSSTSLTYDTGKTCTSAWNSSSAWLKFSYNYAATNQISICFWVKPNSPVAWADIFSFGEYYNRLEITNTTNYSWYVATDGSALLASGTVPFAMNNATWYHVAIVADGSNVRFYLDGVLKKTVTQNSTVAAAFGGSTDFLISARTTSGNCRYYSYLNDFRIYDNALSTKEVKLLSQGLVAHYQLKGMGRTNYLKGAGLYTKDNPLVRNSSDVSHMNDSYVYYDTSNLSVTVPTDGTYTWVLESDGVPSGHNTSGTVYTSRYFSMWLQNTSTGNHYCWSNYGTGVGGEKYGSVTIPAGTYKIRTNLYAADSVNYTIKFWNIKLVQGTYDPSDIWCPNSEDELYSKMRIDSALWTDCSGYGNTLTQIGTIPVVGNSARYGSCVDFNQTGYLKKDDFGMTTNAFTIAFWINPPSSTNAQHFICGTFNSWTGNGFGMWRDANGANYSALYRSGSESSHTGLTSFYPTIGSWNHVAYVYTGTQGIYYKNGVEAGRVTGGSGGAVSHPVLYIGNSLYNNAPSSETEEASMSDFRFYATALSATDIADLYGNGASLTKDGKLLAYDFHENKRNTIDKDGIVASSGFNVKSIPTYDMKIKALDDGSTWARIHHLDVTNDKQWFANASEVARCLDKHNRYSRMGIVDRYKVGSEYEFMLTYPSMKKAVPAGYTRLEYIEATGTQWINTGVTGAARWEFDIQFTKTDERKLMGYGGDGGEYWGCQVNGRYGLFDSNVIGYAGDRDTIVHDFSTGSSNTLWVENQSIGVGGDDVSSKQYQIFTIVSSTGWACHAKLWRCKCVQSGSLIRDFIPAMRNSDGAIGLIDVVNNVFYTNAGSGVFTAGYKSSYQWLDYVESSGTQYINTGLTTNQDTRIVVKAYYTGVYSIYGAGKAFTNFTANASGGYFYYNDYGGGASPTTNYANAVHTFEQNKNVCYVDGASVHTFTYASFTSPSTMFLFGRNDGAGVLNDAGGTVRIYSCQIYNNGTLMRDFIPCVSPSGEVGMYDKVYKRFYKNAGTGNFIAGTAKESLPLYNRWIQTSSPTATSVTGYKAINTAWTAHNAGIRTQGSACVYNCDTGTTWYAPIGQLSTWTSAQYIPAADGTSQTETELWVRTDRFANEDQLNIYNGSITATGYIEI